MSNEIGFYYPGHLWYDIDQIKNMLLFFDGFGLLMPEYKKDEPEYYDPIIAAPLKDRGLLHYLVADEVVDATATEELVGAMLNVLKSGVLDPLNQDDTAFHTLSRSRMGFAGNWELASRLFEELREKGLARVSEDGVSIPMHPLVRILILIMLAQILRPSGRELGLELSPVTDRLAIVNALSEVLDLPGSSSAGRVVQFDLQTVGVDLSAVPLDEVLDFRNQHCEKFKAYARNLRSFARQVSLLPKEDQDAAFMDRQAELDDYASDLKRRSRLAWKKPATIAVGLAGAAWAATGDPIAGLFAAAGAIVPGIGGAAEHGAYSYLFAPRNRYGV